MKHPEQACAPRNPAERTPGGWHSGLRRCSAWCLGLGLLASAQAQAQAAPATASVEVLKEMPTKGALRQGEVIYVDDRQCPAGEVKKITGGNQKTGVARQTVCVKNPVEKPGR